MSLQTNNIFSPPLSPCPVNLIEDDIDEINSENERISLRFNDLLACIDSDSDDTITSDVDIEDFEREVREQGIFNEIDEIIDHLEQTRLTPCVIIDFY
jgi:hypothetical protein